MRLRNKSGGALVAAAVLATVLLGTVVLTTGACTGTIGSDAPAAAPTCDEEGVVRLCYPASAPTQGIGACHDGSQTCLDGAWGDCTGFAGPADEACDDGIDDDCNGLADDGCPCEPGASQPCYTGPAASQGIGACNDGLQHCADGTWATGCEEQMTPSVEQCDTLDNDCNGITDEGCDCVDGNSQSCYGGPSDTKGVGLCHGGEQSCNDGSWSSSCSGQRLPAAESCNGSDDDCDGKTDEGNPGAGASCDTGVPGICAAGERDCQGGKLVCVQLNSPASKDACGDGIDNDCDGTVDEGVGESCNLKDDDCDGQIDEDISAPCTVFGTKGVCSQGSYQCSAGVLDCIPNQGPSTETCDGKDNDCDGTIDDGNPGGGGSCTANAPGICANGSYKCVGGSLDCVAGPAKTEVCNFKDDDCDGNTDEGLDGGSCSTGYLGECAAGTFICAGGYLKCKGINGIKPEICDNKDNDCDGIVDTFPCGPAKICTNGQCKGP